MHPLGMRINYDQYLDRASRILGVQAIPMDALEPLLVICDAPDTCSKSSQLSIDNTAATRTLFASRLIRRMLFVEQCEDYLPLLYYSARNHHVHCALIPVIGTAADPDHQT